MPHTRRTLELTEKWDVTTNLSGGIAVRNGAKSTAQAVANEGRLFTKDAYFIQDKGIPHFDAELGARSANTALLRSSLRKAALSVPDVQEVQTVEINNFDPITRTLSGSITFTTKQNEKLQLTL